MTTTTATTTTIIPHHFMGRILPTRGSSWRGQPPPLRGGNSGCKESPVLPIPSYPALCREDTTSWIHGRSGTHRELQHNPEFYKAYAVTQSLLSLRRFIMLCKVYLDATLAYRSLPVHLDAHLRQCV